MLLALPVARALCRHWVLTLAAGCVLTVVRDFGGYPADTLLFTGAGAHLWSADGLNVFADRTIQAGVAQLSFYRLTRAVEGLLGVPRFQVTSVVLQFGVVFGMVGLASIPYRLKRVPGPSAVLLAAGGLTLLLGMGSELYLAGHPAQLAVTALWVLAATAALRGRGALAGVLLGLSTTFEPWGVLGAPVLALLVDRRALARAVAACAAVLLAAWGPFLAFGDFAMHHYRWQVHGHSPLAAFITPGEPFGWELRLLQGGLALGCGLAAAVALRRNPHGIWAVPLAVVAARLLVDPVSAGYYWLPAKALALLGMAFFLADRDVRAVALVPLLYFAFLVGLLPQVLLAGALLCGVAVVVALARRAQVLGLDSRV